MDAKELKTQAPEGISYEHLFELAKMCGLIGAYSLKEVNDRIVGYARVVLDNKAVQEAFVRANPTAFAKRTPLTQEEIGALVDKTLAKLDGGLEGLQSRWNLSQFAAALIAALPSDAAQAPAVPVELMGVADELKNGEGFWRTCSGCHESEDGHPVGHYPFSAVLNCDLGSGCRECGGIGAVWDDTDYGAMADAWDAQEIACEQPDEAQAPTAWVRFRSDGGFEGPIMDSDSRMCDTRRTCGAWTPLYAAPVNPAAAAPKTMEEVFEMAEKIKTDPKLLEQLRAAVQSAERSIATLNEERRIDPAMMNVPMDAPLRAAAAQPDERAAFEDAWQREMNVEVFDLHRTEYPMTHPDKQQYGCHETNRGWIIWQAPRSTQQATKGEASSPIDQRFDALRATGHGLYGALRNIVNSDKAALIEIRAICGTYPVAGSAGQAPSDMKEGRWCPDECPITGLKFFMWLDHPELGYVPTYGGPFDSYTLAALDEDGLLRSERYDHDRGEWIEGGHPMTARDELIVAAEGDEEECLPTPESERAAFNGMMCWHLIRLLQAWRYGGDLRAAGMAAFEWARTNDVGQEAFKASERAVKTAAPTAPSLTTDAGAVLTDEQIHRLARRWGMFGSGIQQIKSFARDVFAAARAANPTDGADARAAALEEAAKVADAEAENARQEHYYPGVVGAFEDCAKDIRALITPQHMSDGELQQFLRMDEQFSDCNETDVDHTLLLKWVRDGLLDCTHYVVTDKGNAVLDAARKAEIERSGGDQ